MNPELRRKLNRAFWRAVYRDVRPIYYPKSNRP